MRAVHFIVLLLGIVCGSWPTVAAENFPTRPIKFVVGFLAGGPNDTIARIFCDWLQPRLGAPCVVENKVGQGGMIAAKSVIDSPPDGYTIMFVAPNNAIGQSLYKSLPFNHVRDTTPIAGIMQLANMMVVPPSLPVKNVAEFIAYGKANPGKLSYASGSSSAIVSGATFAHNAGLDLLHVPYKSSPPALNDVMGGRVSMMFVDILTGLPHVNGNALRALAVTTKDRTPLVPNLPSMQEAGVPDFDISSWQGYFGPAGMPKEIVTRLNAEIRKIVEKPEIKAQLATLGMDAFSGTPEELGTFVNEQLVLWEKLIKDAGIEKQ
jgi:tripartite-type tricarboxylate transporter receptor subunit TctC